MQQTHLVSVHNDSYKKKKKKLEGKRMENKPLTIP